MHMALQPSRANQSSCVSTIQSVNTAIRAPICWSSWTSRLCLSGTRNHSISQTMIIINTNEPDYGNTSQEAMWSGSHCCGDKDVTHTGLTRTLQGQGSKVHYFKRILNLFLLVHLCVCMYRYVHVSAGAHRDQRYQTPSNWSHRWLELPDKGIQLGAFARPLGPLHCWAIFSPAPKMPYFKELYTIQCLLKGFHHTPFLFVLQ